MQNGMADYCVEICDDTEGFHQLRALWQQMEHETGHCYLTASYEWLKSWWSVFNSKGDTQFGFNKKLRILLFYQGGEVVAIAPLIEITRKKWGVPFRFIEFLGQQWGAAFTGITSRTGLQGIGKALRQMLARYWRYDTLHLTHIPLDDPLLENGQAIPFSGCPVVFLPTFENFSQYVEQVYSKHQRHNIRTLTNKAVRHGLNYSIGIEEACVSHLPNICRLSRSKQADGKQCIYEDADKQAFIRRIIETFPAELLWVYFDGQAVAYRLNVLYRGWKYCLDASYDRDYRLYGPGLLSLHESLKDSFDRGIGVHCEGPGLDFYKIQQTPGSIPLYTVIQPGGRLLGALSTSRLRCRYAAAVHPGGPHVRTN